MVKATTLTLKLLNLGNSQKKILMTKIVSKVWWGLVEVNMSLNLDVVSKKPMICITHI